MVSLKQKRQSGFTIVELLIVIIIIGILAGLVVTQILGANQKARDTERKTDLDSIANQLEVYYAKASGYPTQASLVDQAWRTGNEFVAGDQAKALYDPSSGAVIGSAVPTTTTGAYTYVPTPAGCVSPTDNAGVKVTTGTLCSGYTLTALLENAKDPSKDGSSTATQTFYIKKSANQ